MPAGTVGHLLVKGATTAKRLLEPRERTRARCSASGSRTGDVFRQDADGWFYFEGEATTC